MIQYSKHLILSLICCFFIACLSKEREEKKNKELIEKGYALFQNSGCAICHSLKGDIMYGPALDSILNTQVTVNRAGSEVNLTIDKEYIIRAIKDPDFEKVNEYQSKKMPIPTLNDEQIETLTEYLILINKDNRKAY